MGKGKNKRFRRAALVRACDEVQDAFLCDHKGVRLEEYDTSDPWYITYHHVIPGKKGELVVTSMLMNGVKGDLSEDEFYLVMNELARHFEGNPFDRNTTRANIPCQGIIKRRGRYHFAPSIERGNAVGVSCAVVGMSLLI